MANRKLLLNLSLPGNRMRERRRRRKHLVYFLDALVLHLQVGYDLAYSWRETSRALRGEITDDFRELLEAKIRDEEWESQGAILTRLVESYPDPPHRVWFSSLRELYTTGAPLRDAVAAVAEALRQEQARDLEAHCRTLPSRLNVVLLLFFLPPTFLLLFAPLMHSLTQSLGLQ